MANHDERIQALETKLKQAKALKAKAERRKHEAEKAAQRAADTRRKVLAGACVMALAAKDQSIEGWLREVLDAGLKRVDERALFGLQPLPDGAPESVAPVDSVQCVAGVDESVGQWAQHEGAVAGSF